MINRTQNDNKSNRESDSDSNNDPDDSQSNSLHHAPRHMSPVYRQNQIDDEFSGFKSEIQAERTTPSKYGILESQKGVSESKFNSFKVSPRHDSETTVTRTNQCHMEMPEKYQHISFRPKPPSTPLSKHEYTSKRVRHRQLLHGSRHDRKSTPRSITEYPGEQGNGVTNVSTEQQRKGVAFDIPLNSTSSEIDVLISSQNSKFNSKHRTSSFNNMDALDQLRWLATRTGVLEHKFAKVVCKFKVVAATMSLAHHC